MLLPYVLMHFFSLEDPFIYIGDWALDKTAESMWEMSSYHDNQNSDSVLAKSFQPRPLLLQGQIVHHETNFILLVMHCAYSD